MKRLIVAPINIKSRLISMIEKEATYKQDGLFILKQLFSDSGIILLPKAP